MTQKVRNSNLEFYRIITMLAIVAHHYVVNSGLMGGISCVKVIFRCILLPVCICCSTLYLCYVQLH